MIFGLNVKRQEGVWGWGKLHK